MRPFRSPRAAAATPAGRRGMTIPLVLGFLVVAGLLAVAVHTLSRAERGFTLRALHAERAHQAALAAARAAAHRYAARLSDPRDELHARFLASDGPRFDLPAFTAADDPDLARLVEDLGHTTLGVTATLDPVEPLGAGGDPAERRGTLRLDLRVTHRSVERRFRLARAFRFAAAFPAVVPRFTLFVKKTPGERLNSLANDAGGEPVKGRPLILDNGGAADPAANGWIYLGGGRTCLNLARGDASTGEDFHLPDAVTRSPFFPDQNYLLLNLNIGFHETAGEDPVFARFPARDAFKGSLLRLFGCPAAGEAPTPTLVLGDVWRRYLQAAGVGPLRDGRLAGVTPLPWSVSQAHAPRGPFAPPFLFFSPKLYQVYMSQVREEPYNRSIDFILDGGATRDGPPPLLAKRRAPEGVTDPYPAADPVLSFLNARGETVHHGRLSAVTVDRFAGGRVARAYDSPAAWLADRSADPAAIPPLRGVTLIAGGDADLSRDGGIELSGTGSLVFEGSVRLAAVRAADPTADRVVIVSLKGDILCGPGTVEAGLCALNGRVILEGSAVSGFVAAGSLDPDRMRRGGLIAWNPRFAPDEGATEDPYVFASGERILAFREEVKP